MDGNDLKAWRIANGYYTQEDLRKELRIKSRGTISNWENSTKPLSRILELALIALENKLSERELYGRRDCRIEKEKDQERRHHYEEKAHAER